MTLSQREKERLAAALPPFDGIDLALATHDHYDHVTPHVIIDYLAHSPSTLFASLVETVDLLRDVPGRAAVSDRILGIPNAGVTAEPSIPGARVTAFPVRHSGVGDNLAFLVT